MVFEVFIMPFLLLIQNEIKNVKKENGSKVTRSEEIYSTLDDVLGGEYLFVGNIQTETKISLCPVIIIRAKYYMYYYM